MNKAVKKNRRAIIVIGMHRSGTSALARTVNLCGVDLGSNLMPPAQDNNEKGFWENSAIHRIHEMLFRDLNSSWDDVRSLQDGWWNFDIVQKYKLEIVSILEREFAKSRFWGIKDPRICRLLPLMHPLIEQMGCKPYYLIIVRNPLEVVASLAKRDGFSEGKSCFLWLRHLIESEKGTRNSSRVFVTYEELLSNWKKVMSRIQRSFGFRWPVTLKKAGPEIEAFLENRLRHNLLKDSVIIGDKNINKSVRDAYLSVKNANDGEDEPITTTLESIEVELNELDKLYAPVLSEFWDRHHLISGNLQERDQQIDDTRKRLEESQRKKAQKESVIIHLQAVKKEKDDRISELNSELRASKSELKSLNEKAIATETRLAGLESKVKEREERIQQLDAEMKSLGSELTSFREAALLTETKIGEMQAKVKERNERLLQLDSAGFLLQKKFNAIQETVVDRESEINHLETSIKDKKLRIQGLDSEVLKLQNQLTEAEKSVVRTDTEIAFLKGRIKEKDELIYILNENVERLQSELKSSRESVSTLEASYDEIQSVVNERNDKIRQLDFVVKTLKKELSEFKNAESKRETELRQFASEIEGKNEHINQLNADAERSKNEIDLLRAQGEHFRREREAILDSTSWKITVPLRWISKKVRNIKPNIVTAYYLFNRQYRLIKKSSLFDVAFYLEKYPDVAASRIDPTIHYIKSGAEEGKDPHPLFNSRYYLAHNLDVREAKVNPLWHYLKYGWKERQSKSSL